MMKASNATTAKGLSLSKIIGAQLEIGGKHRVALANKSPRAFCFKIVKRHKNSLSYRQKISEVLDILCIILELHRSRFF